LLCLRDALRSGDVFVPGSRRYANPIAYLIPQDAWAGEREEFCRLSGIPAEPATALTLVETELATAISELDGVLAGGRGRCASTRTATWSLPRCRRKTSPPRSPSWATN